LIKVGENLSDSGSRGFRPSDMLALPEEERRLLLWLLRRGKASADEAAGQFGLDPAAALSMLDALAKRGFVKSEGNESHEVYQPQPVSTRTAWTLPEELWRKLRDP
jgi:DNA-binding MarR family transcriptional regulator